MDHDRRTRVRGARKIGILGAAFAALVLFLPTPSSTTASDRSRYESALERHTRELRLLRHELTQTELELASARREREHLVRSVQSRLRTIYTAGGGVIGIERVVAARGSVRGAIEAADVVATVAEHDERELRRYTRLGREIDTLERRIARLDNDIAAQQQRIRRDRQLLAEARRREQEARERAQRMARIADKPLTPAALSPETVETRVANASQPAPEPEPSGFTQSGIASMYADSFAGKPTASGEPYDPGAMTAAHRTLPLGTWVSVRGPGGTALVRINDRGPFIGGRIIDLSRAAANAVGLGGLGHVTITVQS